MSLYDRLVPAEALRNKRRRRDVPIVDVRRFNRICWREGWPSLADPSPFPRLSWLPWRKRR